MSNLVLIGLARDVNNYWYYKFLKDFCFVFTELLLGQLTSCSSTGVVVTQNIDR